MYCAQGTSTQASPHQSIAMEGMVAGKPYPCTGTVFGIPPEGSCSAFTSRSHFSRKRLISKLKHAVGANTAISPVHPIRSSLWGQSVGMSTKFDLLLQMIFCCRRLIISLEQVNSPIRSISE